MDRVGDQRSRANDKANGELQPSKERVEEQPPYGNANDLAGFVSLCHVESPFRDRMSQVYYHVWAEVDIAEQPSNTERHVAHVQSRRRMQQRQRRLEAEACELSRVEASAVVPIVHTPWLAATACP